MDFSKNAVLPYFFSAPARPKEQMIFHLPCPPPRYRLQISETSAHFLIPSGPSKTGMESLKAQINPERLPKHIAIIMDGNGRWAKGQGQDRLFGHYHGVQSVRNVTEACAELGVGYLTLYAFSTENWDRPPDEVSGLMELLVDTIQKEVPTLNKNNIRLHVIGNTEMLPKKTIAVLREAIGETASNSGLNLIMALSYSSRWEMGEAARQIGLEVKAGRLDPETIDQEVFQKYLCTRNFPDPELMIRTSGEHRISNFLLYQLAYAELFFTPVLWPDFQKENLIEAILDFQTRERRFGKTSEQLG
jgi:undecaprenyl diphosphate synthase